MNLSFFKSRPFLFCDWRQCYTCHHQVSMPTERSSTGDSRFGFNGVVISLFGVQNVVIFLAKGVFQSSHSKICIEWFFAKSVAKSANLLTFCEVQLSSPVLDPLDWAERKHELPCSLKTLNRGSSAFCGTICRSCSSLLDFCEVHLVQ